MIAREWRCIAWSENVARYLAHFEESVLPELRELEGFQEARILRRSIDDSVEITVITFWDSMDAIRRFAGTQVDQAVVEPNAQAVLKSFDTTVIHYDVLLKTG
jgi:heme-degrading monooxygenase HmoA